MTQEKIAGFLDLKQPHLNMILKGHRRPSWKVACRLAAFYGQPASFWMDATPEEIKTVIENYDYDRPVA